MTASMLWRSAVLEVDKLLLFDLNLEFHHFLRGQPTYRLLGPRDLAYSHGEH